jgi:hypothetical protein
MTGAQALNPGRASRFSKESGAMKRNIAISMAAGLGLATVAGTAFSAGLPTAAAPALTGVQLAQAAMPEAGTKHILGKVTKIDVQGRTLEIGNDMGATETYFVRTAENNDLTKVKVGDNLELAFVEAAGRKEIVSWSVRDAEMKPAAPEPAR